VRQQESDFYYDVAYDLVLRCVCTHDGQRYLSAQVYPYHEGSAGSNPITREVQWPIGDKSRVSFYWNNKFQLKLDTFANLEDRFINEAFYDTRQISRGRAFDVECPE
jgi:hypothetical protein